MGVIPPSQAESGPGSGRRGAASPGSTAGRLAVGFGVGARRDGGSSNKEEPRLGRGRGLLAYP